MNKSNFLMSQLDQSDTGERIQPIFKDTESSDGKSDDKKYQVEDDLDQEFLQEVADIKSMMAQMGTNLDQQAILEQNEEDGEESPQAH